MNVIVHVHVDVIDPVIVDVLVNLIGCVMVDDRTIREVPWERCTAPLRATWVAVHLGAVHGTAPGAGIGHGHGPDQVHVHGNDHGPDHDHVNVYVDAERSRGQTG